MTAARGLWSPVEVNVLSDDKKQQVLVLGRLGWTLRRIEETTGIRRETASKYLKAAGVSVRSPRARSRPKPASEEGVSPRVSPRGTPEQAVRRTHSVNYAETELVQSGHEIINVTISGGQKSSFSNMLDFYEKSGFRTPTEHDAILKRYDIRRDDIVLLEL